MSELPAWTFPVVDNDGRAERSWFEVFRFIHRRVKLPVAPSFTVAQLAAAPMTAAANTGAVVLVTNETGGAVLAFSDGSNWRRSTDRAVVS